MNRQVDEILMEEIEKIIQAPESNLGVDILILSTNSETVKTYWEEKLLASRGAILKREAQVIAIHEDWPGGAGNAFGTLFAFQEADKIYQKRYKQTLFEQLELGKSIAIYHTAGKGSRLAPLSLAEYNNKPGVQLPAFLKDSVEPLTVLEMVIRQTAPLSQMHKGRVLVFWSDQLFIPAITLTPPQSHIELFAKRIPFPSSESWHSQNLDNYGLLSISLDKKAQLTNKITYQNYQKLVQTDAVDPSLGLGVSLGSFSISQEFLKALLVAFEEELFSKTGQLDADLCLWMPATLDEVSYLSLMQEKGYTAYAAKEYYQKAKQITEPFSKSLFSVQNIGQEGYWWDFGTCQSFYNNCMKLLQPTAEGYHLRLLFGFKNMHNHNHFERTKIDSSSLIVNSTLSNSDIKRSIIVGLDGIDIRLNEALVIGGLIQNADGHQCLLYHVFTPGDAHESYPPQTVRADLFYPPHEEPLTFYTHLYDNGHHLFDKHLKGNCRSFENQFLLNQALPLQEALDFAYKKKEEAKLYRSSFKRWF